MRSLISSFEGFWNWVKVEEVSIFSTHLNLMSSRTSDLKDLAPVCIMPAEKHGKRSRQAPLESDLMCCINELPDEMLMNILSNLEVKEAAKTSVLSRKWRNLWTFSANLDFDRTWKKLWKKLWENLEIDVRDLWMLYSDTKRQKHGVHKFMESVSNVLDRHRGSTLDRLRIAFNMHFYCPCIEQYVAKWVDFALVKRVRILELDLTSASGSDVSESACAFPSWLLSIPLDLPCFDRLTALCLNSVSISDAELAYFLSSCPLLEQLSVRNARGLKNVRVSGVALTLNRLEIGSNYVCDQLESVEICAPNLTSFKYGWCREPTVKMCLTDVPKLAWISLRNSSCEHSIVKFHNDLCLSRMKKLELDLRSMDHDRCLQFPRSFPELNNLEDLGLKFIVREDENLLFLNSIIAASPCLQKLTMEVHVRLN
ncbi:OLC1v1028156C1 [Oldenlandia corymbosa var. corymbosa]|uniref:OLC1v1028156C1 n=1 Tax=Oldenlandia corymbosa var. corymbosa TaxID=529605 RepID=A0AAV1CB43_OLDCO|nr:OLC1v1028156C1 [Oldenlandia corymbosa var. corymbosa]